MLTANFLRSLFSSIREFRSLTCLPFTDTEIDRQEKPKKQENNNSVFANEKSSPEKRTNGTMDTSNASMANTPDLSPVKNIRNGEVEDAEVRKTKVSSRLTFCTPLTPIR